MNEHDLFDSIGNVDDELIENAKRPVGSRKRIYAAIISAAACAVFACAGLFWMNGRGVHDPVGTASASSWTDSPTKQSSASSAGQYVIIEGSERSEVSGEFSETTEISEETSSSSSGTQSSQIHYSESSASVSYSSQGESSGYVSGRTESSEEASCHEHDHSEISEPEVEDPIREIYIYYSEDGEMKKKPISTHVYDRTVFEEWKNANSIGEEVLLLNTLYEVGGERITDPGFDLAEVAAPGHEKTVTLVVFVTNNFESYYTRPDKDLLLSSLQMTMLNAFDITPDEVSIELWQEDTPISLASANVYYVEDGELKKERMFIDSTTTELFETWRSRNNVSRDVDFVAAYELDGELLADPHYTFYFNYYASNKLEEATEAGQEKKLSYVIYVTDNINHDRTDVELLLKSLEMTLLEVCDYEPDEYRTELVGSSDFVDVIERLVAYTEDNYDSSIYHDEISFDEELSCDGIEKTAE